MAGPDPGMVVRVAADLTDFERMMAQATAIAAETYQDIAAAAEGAATDQGDVTAAVADSVAAYDKLEAEGVPALRAIDKETEAVGGATDSMAASMTAAGVAIRVVVIAAALVGEALRTAAGWAKDFVVWVGDVSGVTDDATATWAAFKQELGESIAQTGVIKAGYDSLKASILQAFGGDTQAVIRAVTNAVNTIAITAIDVGLVLVEWAGTAARVFGVVKGPIDALTVAINYVVTGFLDGVALMAGAASHLPFVGDDWADVQARVQAYADSWREVRDRTVAQMQADDAMAKGQGAVHAALQTTTDWLVKAKTAMLEANATQHEATAAATAHAAALEKEFAAFDKYQAAHTKYGPEILLQLGQVEKKVQDVGIATAADMDKWAAWESAHTKWGPDLLLKLGTYEKKLIDTTGATDALASSTDVLRSNLKFTADTVADDVTPALDGAERAMLSFSDAMDLVRQGKGTMTGQIPSGPTRRNAFGQPDTDPYGWMWDSWRAQQATWFPNMALADVGNVFQVGAGGATTQNVTVNTVMGDKQEIARIVKEAIADDWRTRGVRA